MNRSRRFKQLVKNDALIDSNTATELLIESCIIPNLSAALFRRDVLVEVGILSSSYSVVSDWDLFFKIARKYDIAYVHSCFNSFRQHSTTIRNSTKNRKMLDEYFELLFSQLRPRYQGRRKNRLIRISIVSKWISFFLIDPVEAIQNLPYHTRFLLGRDPKVFLYFPYAIAHLLLGRINNEN